jgi:hypothetical protein
MIIVFAVGMSMPDSMIVVATRMSASRRMNASMTARVPCGGICPCPTTIRASGASAGSRRRRGLDVVHAVVDEVDLPLAGELALDRAA